VSGIGRYTVVRNHRGRKRRWDDAQLERFAAEFITRGASWTDEHEGWARDSWELGPRRALEIMREAETAGIVEIEKRGGPRSPNVYLLRGQQPRTRTAQGAADWHRGRWMVLNRKRHELEANWQSALAGAQS
jgi:hypothetical protein